MAETQKLPKSLYGVVVVRNRAGDLKLIAKESLEDTLYSAEDANYEEDLEDEEDDEDEDDDLTPAKTPTGVKNGTVFVIGEYKLVKTLRVNRRIETKIVTSTVGGIQVSEVSVSRRVNFDDDKPLKKKLKKVKKAPVEDSD